MNQQSNAYRNLHIAVFLYGITAILGDLITLAALPLVWWRVLITSLSLLLFIRPSKLRKIDHKIALKYMFIGVVVALHWLTFYGAIKLANASVALICFATTSIFTALIEPYVLKKKIDPLQILLGFLVIPGMVFIVHGTDSSMNWGIIAGVISALLAAIFSVLNKKMIGQADDYSITFLEMGSAWVFLSFIIPIVYYLGDGELTIMPTKMDWVYLLILAIFCTTLAYILTLKALHHISAFAANLTINLEPIYGIILAWLILDDGSELDASFYWGSGIIILSVLVYPLLRRRVK